MKLRTVCPLAISVLLMVSAGCGKNAAESQGGFDIPPSLIYRMSQAYNESRNKMMKIEGLLDGEEMVALMQQGFRNGYEIAARPRGDMVFADDGIGDEERKKLWPFDVESFEATLEAQMGRDENGLFGRKSEGDNELEACNPTFRWINAEMEEWAVKQLDAAFPRMDNEIFSTMFGEEDDDGEEGDEEDREKTKEDNLAWIIAKNRGQIECFRITRCDGAWANREYHYFLWNGKDNPSLYASFDSFPNRKEAATMRAWRTNPAALNNLAVLYWRHRIFRLGFDPAEIRAMLELAARDGVSCAKQNISVLLAHIPEVEADSKEH